MKKNIMVVTTLLLITICFSLQVCAMESIDTDEAIMSVDEVQCCSYALNFVESYYQKIYNLNDNNGIFEYELYPANDTVREYIQERNILSGIAIIFHPVKNYVGKFSISEVKTVENYIHVKIKCNRSFSYPGSKITSGIGNPFFLTFEKNNSGEWSLICFHQSDLLDAYILGFAETMNAYIEIFKPINSDHINTVKKSQSDNIENYSAIYSTRDNSETKMIEPDFSSKILKKSNLPTLNAINSISTIYQGLLDIDEVMWYALENCEVTTPSSGGYNVPYNATLFADEGGDCTNFMSHCLLAGGARPVYPPTTGHQEAGWYYRSSTDRSYCWSNVRHFYNFLTGNPELGPSGVGYLVNGSFAPFDWGNIVQINYIDSIDNDTDWGHTTIITGYDNNSIPYITSRTNADSHNKHIPITQCYPESTCEGYRVIVLDNYYKYTNP